MVRPILEYSSSVWDPHVQTLTKQLEAVQNRAARFVTGIFGGKTSITAIKKQLGWSELETRRKVARLKIFHQTLTGQLAIPVHSLLRPVKRTTRNTAPDNKNFIPLAPNKDCFKKSFLPRTIIDWNSLPRSSCTYPNVYLRT